MIKTICICDKCRKPAERAVGLDFGILIIETGDVEEDWEPLPERIHLCEDCATELKHIIMDSHGGSIDVIQQEVVFDTKNPVKPARTKIDVGKIVALRNAGWKVKDIADEMGLTPNQITQVLYREKKKREKESEENGYENQ